MFRTFKYVKFAEFDSSVDATCTSQGIVWLFIAYFAVFIHLFCNYSIQKLTWTAAPTSTH